MKHFIFSFLFVLLTGYNLFGQHSIYEPLDLSKVKWDITDFGTMNTFDAVPVERYEKQYGFKPDKAWLNHAQKSALQLGNGCSAAFVSADGLILTNHHCIRGDLPKVQQGGENIQRDGFYAETKELERIIPGLFVDMLMTIDDVTADIYKAMEAGKTDKEKVELKEKKMAEIVAAKEKETGLKCMVVTLYNGGKYSLHSYKRYTDIRLVMAPDVQITATGWDWDNFTYPRYELDFAFLRAYENGKPVKPEHFFKWSQKGTIGEEPVFVIGRPGNTDRLLSVSELNFYKNVRYPVILHRLNENYQAYYTYFMAHPDRQAEILSKLLSIANGRKVYAGLLLSLKDEYLMTKKLDFENSLKQKVQTDPKLKTEYGTIWDDLQATLKDIEQTDLQFYLYAMAGNTACNEYLTANNLYLYATQMQLPEAERAKPFKAENLEKTKANIFVSTADKELNELLLAAYVNYLYKAGTENNNLFTSYFNKKKGLEGARLLLAKTKLNDKAFVEKLLTQKPEDILKTDDAMFKLATEIQNGIKKLNSEREAALNKLEILNQKLGKLIFDVYGTQIPPDATSTLRISDGIVKGYEYNGTIAPGKNTFYGLYDRYFSFGSKDYPWGLHDKWKKIPEGLDLSVPICFASTNDIVGGNSGSSVINKNGEVVGLMHDGNMESIGGGFAFLPEYNRSIATDSWGLIESLKYVYKTPGLLKELGF